MTNAAPLRIAAWSFALLSLCTGSWLPLVSGVAFAATWMAGCMVLEDARGAQSVLRPAMAA